MNRREFIRLSALAGIAAAQGRPLWADLVAAGSDVYRSAMVVDACGGPGGYRADPKAALPDAMVQDARSSGISCVSCTVGPVGSRPDHEALEGIFRDLGFWENELELHPDVFVKVKKMDDIRLAKSSGRVGLIFALQDGVAFENDLSRLEMLYRFGLRIIQPTYNLRNLLGDGCLEPDNAGLSKRGHEAVQRMNELEILIDLSHCGRRTTQDVMTASSHPVAFTHTGCAAICDHPRNKTDEELRALSEKGGVAGIYFMPYLRSSGQPMAEDVIRSLEHAVQVAGEDHVGIGTDLDISPLVLTPEFLKAHKESIAERRKAGIAAPGEQEDIYLYIPDLNTNRRLETLADLLLKRGHSSAQVEKILGGNFARLFGEVFG